MLTCLCSFMSIFLLFSFLVLFSALLCLSSAVVFWCRKQLVERCCFQFSRSVALQKKVKPKCGLVPRTPPPSLMSARRESISFLKLFSGSSGGSGSATCGANLCSRNFNRHYLARQAGRLVAVDKTLLQAGSELLPLIAVSSQHLIISAYHLCKRK